MRPTPRLIRPVIGGAIIAVVVVAFTRGWHDGRTTLDGNGVVLYVDIALHYWRSAGHVPYWIPDLWTGVPVWALAPIFPVLTLLPLARLVGPEAAVRYMTVLLQIVGGWGAMTLAASLWRDERRAKVVVPAGAVDVSRVAAVVAGCLYALHPLVITHGTLFGHETTIAVLAATPWLVWAVRRGLRGDGVRWIVLAGLTAAFAILNQAEHAYALVIFCALIAGAQVALAVRGVGGWGGSIGDGWRGPAGRIVRRAVLRATAVVAVIGGAMAHWLVPLSSLHRSFILSPPDVVTASLTNGIGAQLAGEPGAFLTRSSGVAKVVTYQHPDILRSGSFYLGWVWLVGAAVALVILAFRPHRDRDATLSALLLGSAISVWMSTAATPLARSGPGLRHQWPALAAIGLLGGLCAGVYIRRVASGRAARVSAFVAVIVLFALPYVTPFLVLQRLIPLAGNLRLPRLYPVAALGLSLGAAYPLTLFDRALVDRTLAHARRRPEPGPRLALQRVRIVQLGAIAAAVGLIGVAIVDIWPYRTFYRTRPPADTAAYAAATPNLPTTGRLITEQFGDPRVVQAMYRSGRSLAIGWPHPLAEHDLWALAVTPQEAAPSGYRDAAAALAGSSALIVEHDVVPPDPQTLAQAAAQVRQVSDPNNPAPDLRPGDIEVDPIGAALPVVRSYDQAVVVSPSTAATTELAVGLEPDHLSVVQGGKAAITALGPIAVESQPETAACPTSGAEVGGLLGHEIGIACALHHWVGKYFGLGATYLGPGVGALFNASTGLTGVALWLLGPTKGVVVELRPQAADGSLGAPLVTVHAGAMDRNGLVTFPFPTSLPAGRYGFEALCPGCSTAEQPKLVFTSSTGRGDLILADRQVTDLDVAFAPMYPRKTPVPASSAQLTTVTRRPGQWAIDVQADRPQLVVVSEANFPGWHATIDGRAAPTLTADVAFVGVPVPAGVHHLTLRYRAPGVRLGDGITVLTLVACGVACVVRRRAPSTPGEHRILQLVRRRRTGG